MTIASLTKGRPTVFSQDTVYKLEQALAMDCTVKEACSLSGVSRSAFYKHMEADKEFMDRMERARLYVTIRARHVVAQAIRNGDVKMSKWYLERKRASEFSLRRNSNIPVTNNYQNMSNLELRRIVENM